MSASGFVGAAEGNSWLLAFSASALLVLACGALLRRAAQHERAIAATRRRPRSTKGIRRRAGSLIVLGSLVGFLASSSRPTKLLVIVTTAGLLTIAGASVERRGLGARPVMLGARLGGALIAVAAGLRLPTGVSVLDPVAAFVFIVVVSSSVDGFGDADGLVAGMGFAASLALFGIAGFGDHLAPASVALGLAGACGAFLAFNTRPASLFVGVGGRAGIGYLLASLALLVEPTTGTWRRVAVPVVLLAIFLVDALVVVIDRALKQHPVFEPRPDHLPHRLVALGWRPSEAVLFIVGMQLLLAVDALLLGRAGVAAWLGVGVAAAVAGAVAIEGARARLGTTTASLGWRGRAGFAVVALALTFGILPVVLVAGDAAGTDGEG